ncbi:MAG: DUF1015 domain-containing protein [Candidatus Omnitrophota bacterium]
MAEVRPFRGLVYDPVTVGDVSRVMAPPYDVISDEKREELYGKSDFNVVRLILGKDVPGDGRNDNKYIRSKKAMNDWMEKGVLATDEQEAFYVYLQQYEVKGRRFSRTGFLGLMKIEGTDVVLPHEHTLSKPKEDRMSLIGEVECNLSPIFGLYSGDEGYISGKLKNAVSGLTPFTDIEIDGVRHVIWKLFSADVISEISEAMETRKIFIADGHHRYAVAKAYRDLCRSREGYDGRADHVLMYLTDMDDPENLTVLATHRVINNIPEDVKNGILLKIERYFNITEIKGLSALMDKVEELRRKSYVYGFFDGIRYFLIEPRETEDLKNLIRNKPESWKDLDVSVLHSVILEKLLGIQAKEGDVSYAKEPEEAESLVKEAGGRAAFFLNPTRVEQLRAVAEDGEMMPQKSTYFYPKLLTGLVMNRFEDQKEKVI